MNLREDAAYRNLSFPPPPSQTKAAPTIKRRAQSTEGSGTVGPFVYEFRDLGGSYQSTLGAELSAPLRTSTSCCSGNRNCSSRHAVNRLSLTLGSLSSPPNQFFRSPLIRHDGGDVALYGDAYANVTTRTRTHTNTTLTYAKCMCKREGTQVRDYSQLNFWCIK